MRENGRRNSHEETSLLNGMRAALNSRRGCTPFQWVVIGAFVILIVLDAYFVRTLQGRIVSENVHSHQEITELKDELTMLRNRFSGWEIRMNNTVTNEDLRDDVRKAQSDVAEALQLQAETVDRKIWAVTKRLNVTVDAATQKIASDMGVVQTAVDQFELVTRQQLASAHDFMMYQLSGMFTLLTLLITLWHVSSHLQHFARPNVQRKVLAILWMPPIYSITSWLSLIFPSAANGLAIIQSSYEAYVIYMFLSLMAAVLGNTSDIIAIFKRHKSEPLCGCCGKYKGPQTTVYQLQFFAIQFVLIMPFIATTEFILTANGISGLWWDYMSPFLYLDCISNVSVTVALYALVKFYHITQEELAWINPWPKFLCIKGVVFMTYYQGLALEGAANLGFVDRGTGATAQNFLICIEMLLAALVHPFVFSFEEWQEDYQPENVRKSRLMDQLALGDFMYDLKELLRKKRKPSSNTDRDAKQTGPPLVNSTESEFVNEAQDLDEVEAFLINAVGDNEDDL